MTSSQPPQHGVVSAEETGRSCPYCRFPLKQGIEMTRCGVCAAPHHADCWSDNGGCAVVACPGGPQAHTPAGTAPPPLPPPPVVPVTVQSPPPPPPTPPPPTPVASAGGSGPRRTGPWIVAGAIVLALALAGGAFAVVISGTGGSSGTRTIISVQGNASGTSGAGSGATVADGGADGADGSAPVGATTPDTSTSGSDPDAGAARAFPPADESARAEIEQLLTEHHQDIVDGDYRGAWDLMTKRKQVQKLHEEGFARWAQDQGRILAPYLIPSGLHVEFADYDRSTGVARVLVTGMGWTKRPDTCGGRYEGLTWVKYENGAWRYDPGYSTTTDRERHWSTRPQPYYQLLGTQCE